MTGEHLSGKLQITKYNSPVYKKGRGHMNSKLQCPRLKTALSGLKKTFRTSRRRRLNLSAGYPIVCNLGFVFCNFPDKLSSF